MGYGYVYGMGYGYDYGYGYAWKFHGQSYGQSYGNSADIPTDKKENSRTSYHSEALLYCCLQSLVWVCASVRNGGNMQIIEEGGFEEP